MRHRQRGAAKRCQPIATRGAGDASSPAGSLPGDPRDEMVEKLAGEHDHSASDREGSRENAALERRAMPEPSRTENGAEQRAGTRLGCLKTEHITTQSEYVASIETAHPAVRPEHIVEGRLAGRHMQSIRRARWRRAPS